MDYASKEVIQKCGEVRQFAQAFALYLAIQGFVGDIADDAFVAISERHHSVTEEFAPRFHSVLKRSTATPQDEAYELLFSYKEKMEPVVKMLQVELDNLGSSENIQRQFQEVFIF